MNAQPTKLTKEVMDKLPPAATGVMTGTFSQPMPIGEGKTIDPTGNQFALGMVTVGHWSNGKMDHEWLFWDNGDFMKQIGLAE